MKVIEQPASSLMFRHPRLMKLMEKTGAMKIDMDMGCYGSPSPKKTMLVGTFPGLANCKRSMTSGQKRAQKEGQSGSTEVTKQYKAKDGAKKFTAGKDMKSSQSYPAGIGSELGLAMWGNLPNTLGECDDKATEFELAESDVSSGNASDVGCLKDVTAEGYDSAQ